MGADGASEFSKWSEKNRQYRHKYLPLKPFIGLSGAHMETDAEIGTSDGCPNYPKTED